MKKGFALLETIIVITFVSVSLLLLYGTFTNMFNNSEKNIIFDNASDIYKTYFLKEYLAMDHLNDLLKNENIINISCANFEKSDCETLIKNYHISNIYISKYDLKNYDKSKYKANFNEYLNSVTNKDNYLYRLIVEYKNNNTFSYASIGFGDNHE